MRHCDARPAIYYSLDAGLCYVLPIARNADGLVVRNGFYVYGPPPDIDEVSEGPDGVVVIQWSAIVVV